MSGAPAQWGHNASLERVRSPRRACSTRSRRCPRTPKEPEHGKPRPTRPTRAFPPSIGKLTPVATSPTPRSPAGRNVPALVCKRRPSSHRPLRTPPLSSASKRGSRTLHKLHAPDSQCPAAKHPPGRNPATRSQRRHGAVSGKRRYNRPRQTDGSTAVHHPPAQSRDSNTPASGKQQSSSRRQLMRKGRHAAAPGRHAGAPLLPVHACRVLKARTIRARLPDPRIATTSAIGRGAEQAAALDRRANEAHAAAQWAPSPTKDVPAPYISPACGPARCGSLVRSCEVRAAARKEVFASTIRSRSRASALVQDHARRARVGDDLGVLPRQLSLGG